MSKGEGGKSTNQKYGVLVAVSPWILAWHRTWKWMTGWLRFTLRRWSEPIQSWRLAPAWQPEGSPTPQPAPCNGATQNNRFSTVRKPQSRRSRGHGSKKNARWAMWKKKAFFGFLVYFFRGWNPTQTAPQICSDYFIHHKLIRIQDPYWPSQGSTHGMYWPAGFGKPSWLRSDELPEIGVICIHFLEGNGCTRMYT